MFPTGLPPSSGGDYTNKNTFVSNARGTTASITSNGTVDLISITGKGFISELNVIITAASVAENAIGVEALIDGVRTVVFYSNATSTAVFVPVAAQNINFTVAGATTTRASFRMNSPIIFKSSIAIRLRNINASSQTADYIAMAVAIM